MGERAIYAPLPARAFGDERLSGTDMRLLAAIASHDRFGKNGSGCFASQRRLASLIKAHDKAVARSASRLAEFGYLSVERNPMNARLVVYRVIYNEDDAHAMRGDGRSFTRPAGLTLAPAAQEIGDSAVTESDAGKASPRSATGSKSVTGSAVLTGSKSVTEKAAIGNSEKLKAPQNQCSAAANIFSEAENRLREARIEVVENVERQAGELRPPGAGAGEDGLWREADATLSPAEQLGILRSSGEDARPSAALLALQAAMRARGAA